MKNHSIKLGAVALALLGSIAAASATSFSTSTVGVVNPNGHTILESTGNSLTYAAFASTLTTAFANDTGGAWNFETQIGTINVGDTITLSYGTSQTSSLVMTLGGQAINTAFPGTGNATSGTQEMGLSADASTRTFTLATPVLNVGVFVGNRNDSSRTAVLTVTYQDNTTASTSGANAGPAPGSGINYFEDLAGTAENPIVSFSLAQSNFVQYDDLSFIVAPVPEPSTMALGGLGGLAVLALRRRRA